MEEGVRVGVEKDKEGEGVVSGVDSEGGHRRAVEVRSSGGGPPGEGVVLAAGQGQGLGQGQGQGQGTGEWPLAEGCVVALSDVLSVGTTYDTPTHLLTVSVTLNPICNKHSIAYLHPTLLR